MDNETTEQCEHFGQTRVTHSGGPAVATSVIKLSFLLQAGVFI